MRGHADCVARIHPRPPEFTGDNQPTYDPERACRRGTGAAKSALACARYALRVAGTMDWARYRSRDDPVPDGTSTEEGGPLSIRSRHFLADPQSPRDLTRYVRDHDPFGQDQPHYTDEPLLLRIRLFRYRSHLCRLR